MTCGDKNLSGCAQIPIHRATAIDHIYVPVVCGETPLDSRWRRELGIQSITQGTWPK